MKIASANLQMAASHTSAQRHEVRESLKMWTGAQRPRFADDDPRPRLPAGDRVTLSEAGKSAQSAEAMLDAQEEAIDKDPNLRFIRSLIEFLTGRKTEVFDSADLRPDPAQDAAEPTPAGPANQGGSRGFGIEYDRHESYSEFEQTRFEASGTVKTSDGAEISFKIELSMTRSYHEESTTSLRLGDAAQKRDPLILNFSGTSAQLTDQRFSFDLDADGDEEQINFAGSGSGFLVLDRNRDGKINDGKELFGPVSGNGFSELAALDDDSNGWIDENDAAFDELQIWSRDGDGQDQLQSLKSAGVGAISLANITTPFDLKNGNNNLLGQIRSSGVYLRESGAVGSIQQVDLTV